MYLGRERLLLGLEDGLSIVELLKDSEFCSFLRCLLYFVFSIVVFYSNLLASSNF